MAQRRVQISLILVLMTMIWSQSWSQPNPNCMPAITSLTPCLGFVTGNSSAPPPACCAQLASVVQTQAQCLCAVLNGAPPLPFVVNQTQVLTLPGACKIQSPPLSQCNAASGSATPAPAPTSSETPSAATAPLPSTPAVPTKAPVTPSVPSVPSAKGGSKTGSATGASSSASSSTKLTLPLVLFLVAASALTGF